MIHNHQHKGNEHVIESEVLLEEALASLPSYNDSTG